MLALAILTSAGLPALGAAAEDSTMQLPPLFVRESRGGVAWRYTSVGGLEVLSRCDEGTTMAYVRAFLLRQRELDRLLPASLQVQQDVPLTLILITPAVEKTMNEQLVSVMNAGVKGQTSGYVTPWASASQIFHVVRTFPQLTISDSESIGMIYTLDAEQRGLPKRNDETFSFPQEVKSDGAYGDITFTPGRVGSILGGRVPPLPSWFKSGFLSLYGQITWSDPDTIKLGSVVWVSNRLTRKILEENKTDHNNPAGPLSTTAHYSLSREADANAVGAFLPMQKLFAGPSGKTAEEYDLWNSQVSLFLHWAYADAKRRDALWRFVDLSSRQAVTYDLVRQCFGMNSAPNWLVINVLSGFVPAEPFGPKAVYSLHYAIPSRIHPRRDRRSLWAPAL